MGLSATTIAADPALRHLDELLKNSPLRSGLEGAELSQRIPGDGILQIHFGSPDPQHGHQYILSLDETGTVVSFLKTEGATQHADPPALELRPDEVASLLKKFFGTFAIRRTLISVESASAYWGELQRYDVCDEKGSAVRNADGSSGGDGRITNVDINTVAELRRERREAGASPQAVEKEIRRIMMRHRK